MNRKIPSFCRKILNFHCQMRLKSKLPFTAKRDYSRNSKAQLISKCSGAIIISYIEAYAIFCPRMDFFKNLCNVIRFRENQKYRKHVHGNDIQDALSPSTAIF